MQLFRPTIESSAEFAPACPAATMQLAIDGVSVRKVSLENPTASSWSLSVFKRLLDLSVAVSALLVFGAPMLAVAVCVRLCSRGPALFAQHRVGRNGRLFRIYKFRSMAWDAAVKGPGLTRVGDRRITSLGRWLRRLKLDELPQFFNVLRGEMSLVGPRPKLPQYAGIINMPYRPGITRAATLAFRREEEILSRVHPSQLDNFYNQHIRLLKARLDARYMARASFGSDMRLLGATFLSCLAPARAPAVMRASTQVLAFPSQLAHESITANSFETAS